MPPAAAVECAVDIAASCGEVFDVVHDYDLRLRWDTLLSQARVLDGPSGKAALGVRTLCVGRKSLASIGLETVYVSFNRPRVAAVRMTRGPWWIAEFAASIRHTPLPADAAAPPGSARSRVVYKLRLRTRPRLFRFLLDPMMQAIFLWETRKRLAALKSFIETRTAGARSSPESIPYPPP